MSQTAPQAGKPQQVADGPLPNTGEGGDFDPQAYYDPSAYANMQSYVGDDGNTYYYYYQPDDGNGATDEYDSEQNPMSEFYAAAAQGAVEQQQQAHDGGAGAASAAAPTGGASMEAVAETLLRTYEYEDYTPPSNGWMVDVITEMFVSLFFRLYLAFLMVCAGIIIVLLCLSYTYATLYRMFDPPINTGSGGDPFWQSMAYFVIFFVQSFVTIAIICTWVDMMKGIAAVSRQSTSLWGFAHPSLGKSKPPFVFFALILFFTVVFPGVWAGIAVLAESWSILKAACTYFYISITVAMWLVVFCFAWFYWQALLEKRRAYARRFQSDDLREQRIIANGKEEKRVKSNWYYSESALEEYGLERKAVAWSAPVFIIGLVPLFSILSSVAREARTDNPSNAWVAIGVIFLSVLLLIFQMVSSKNHAHRTVFISLALISLLLVLGLIGCGVAGSGTMFAVLFILTGACHGMLLRKRQHSLTRKEVCALMEIAIDREDEEERRDERLDTYMCCCRNTLMASIQWLDIKTVFGYRHPKVREFEKRLVIEHPTLRSDYRILLIWWVVVFGCMCFVVGIGATLSHTFGAPVAASTASIAAASQSSTVPIMCSITYDNTSSSPMGVVDLTMLAVIGNTFGDAADQTYAQWFYQRPTVVREYPTTVSTTKELLGAGNTIPFTVYRNLATDYRIVVLHQQLFGAQLLQAVDYWGEVIALQIAGVLAPWVNTWSDVDKKAFIAGATFFKSALNQNFDPLESASTYIRQSSSYASRKVVVVGAGFNGGYAKILGRRLQIRSVSVNAPGISLLTDSTSVSPVSLGQQSVQVDVADSIMALIDPQVNEVDARFSLPCSETSVGACASTTLALKEMIRTCGDVYGRNVV